jgi:hypothetical protein
VYDPSAAQGTPQAWRSPGRCAPFAPPFTRAAASGMPPRPRASLVVLVVAHKAVAGLVGRWEARVVGRGHDLGASGGGGGVAAASAGRPMLQGDGQPPCHRRPPPVSAPADECASGSRGAATPWDMY